MSFVRFPDSVSRFWLYASRRCACVRERMQQLIIAQEFTVVTTRKLICWTFSIGAITSQKLSSIVCVVCSQSHCLEWFILSGIGTISCGPIRFEVKRFCIGCAMRAYVSFTCPTLFRIESSLLYKFYCAHTPSHSWSITFCFLRRELLMLLTHFAFYIFVLYRLLQFIANYANYKHIWSEFQLNSLYSQSVFYSC